MPHVSTFPLIFLLLTIIAFVSITDGFVLKMIPIDSPHLGILPNKSTRHERYQFLANISLSRTLDHQNESPDSIKQTMYRFRGSYLVTQVSFGEGPGSYSPYLVVDTATHLTWVQCQDCDPCFELKGPSFPYKESTSFAPLGLDDKMCPSRDNPNPYQNACGLLIDAGSSSVSGLFGKETFRFLNSKTGTQDSYPGIVFGCGTKNVGIYFGVNEGPENKIAGLLGLAAYSPLSLVNQLSDQIQGRFAYCITPVNPYSPTQSTLSFGYDAIIKGEAEHEVKTIAMTRLEVGGLYFLYLTGVSVNGKRLAIDASYFGPGENFDRGLFIDSGSPFTRLAESIYDPVRYEIEKYFSDKYKWVPTSPRRLWDLCYPISYFHEWEAPTVTLHFWSIDYSEEVDMELDKDHLFQDMSEEYSGFKDLEGLFCYMVLKVKDPGPCVLGAFQQVNFKFLYDITDSSMSFVTKDCNQEH